VTAENENKNNKSVCLFSKDNNIRVTELIESFQQPDEKRLKEKGQEEDDDERQEPSVKDLIVPEEMAEVGDI
jgi:hypothetical protein